jgi:hypothetical protein
VVPWKNVLSKSILKYLKWSVWWCLQLSLAVSFFLNIYLT